MPDEEKKTVDIDTSGPDVSMSTTFFSLSSGIDPPMIVKIRGIYLQGFPRSLRLRHHLKVLPHPHLSSF